MPKFTRDMIRSILGDAHTDEIENRLIAAHLAVVDPLKDDLQKYKADAEKLPGVQKELDDLKTAGGDWETKYNDEHTAFEKYKSEVAAAAQTEKVKVAYRELLKDVGINEKRFEAILRLTDFSKMKLGDKGLEDVDKLKEAIKSDWADYIPETHEDGADVGNPPDGGKPTPFENMSLTEKMAYANQHPSAPEVMAWLKK